MNEDVQSAETGGRADSPWTTLLTVVMVVGGLFAAALAISFFSQQQNQVSPPEVDFTGVPTEVAAAITRARQLTQATPDSAQAWGQLAMVLRAHDFGPESDACFAQAERLNPQDARWPYLLGVSCAVYDVQGAQQCYRRAVAIDPQNPDLRFARLRLAELLLGVAELESAEEQFRVALRQTPQNAEEDQARAMLGLAQIAWARDDVQASRRWAEQSVARADKQRATRELLSKIYHRLGEREAALRELQILKQLPPGKTSWSDPWVAAVLEKRWDPDYRIQQAQQQFRMARESGAPGQLNAALGQAIDVVLSHPERPSYHAELARMLILARQMPRAAAALDRAIELHPRTAELHRLRGLAAYYQDRLTEAERWFRSSIDVKPDHAEAHENLGLCLIKSGDTQGAIAAFRDAVRFDPNLVGSQMNLGELLLGEGRVEDAIRHLELGIQLGPGDQKAQQLLEQAKAAREPTQGAAGDTDVSKEH